MASRIELLTRLSGIFLAAGIAALCIAVWMYVSFHLHDYLVLMQKARARYKSERPYPRMPETDEAVPEKHTVQNPSDILRAKEKQANEKAKEAVKGAINKDAQPKADAKPKANTAKDDQPKSKEEKTEIKAESVPAAGAMVQAAQPETKETEKIPETDRKPETEADIQTETGAGPVQEKAAPAKVTATADQPAMNTPARPNFRLTRHVLITSGVVPASGKG